MAYTYSSVQKDTVLKGLSSSKIFHGMHFCMKTALGLLHNNKCFHEQARAEKNVEQIQLCFPQQIKCVA